MHGTVWTSNYIFNMLLPGINSFVWTPKENYHECKDESHNQFVSLYFRLPSIITFPYLTLPLFSSFCLTQPESSHLVTFPLTLTLLVYADIFLFIYPFLLFPRPYQLAIVNALHLSCSWLAEKLKLTLLYYSSFFLQPYLLKACIISVLLAVQEIFIILLHTHISTVYHPVDTVRLSMSYKNVNYVLYTRT